MGLLLALTAPWAAAQEAQQGGEKPPGPQFTPGTEVKVDFQDIMSEIVVYVPSDYIAQQAYPVILAFPGQDGKLTTWPFRQLTKGKGFIIIGFDYIGAHAGEQTASVEKRQREFIERSISRVAESLNVNKRIVFLGGFGQGANATFHFGTDMIGRLTGLIMLGGGRNWADRTRTASGSGGKKIFIGVGEQDGVHVGSAKNAAEIFHRAGAHVTMEIWPGVAHNIDFTNTKLGDWLAQFSPHKSIKNQLEKAQNAEKRGELGLAYSLYSQLAQMSNTDETSLAAAEAAKALEAKAQEQFDEAERSRQAKDYPQAASILSTIAGKFKGSKLGEMAEERLLKLREQPEAKVAVERAEAETAADDLEKRAQAAERAGDYAEAISLYQQYLDKFPQGDRREFITKYLAALKSSDVVREQMAGKECEKLLKLARSYIKAGLPDKARPYLNKIIEKHGTTRWANEARTLLRQIK